MREVSNVLPDTVACSRTSPKIEAPSRQIDVDENVAQLAKAITNQTDDTIPWDCRLRYLTVRVECMERMAVGQPVWARMGQVLARLTLTNFRTDQNKT